MKEWWNGDPMIGPDITFDEETHTLLIDTGTVKSYPKFI